MGILATTESRKRLMLAVTVSVAIALLLMTFVVPDQRGELRQDLRVGDYISQDTRGVVTTITIVEIEGDDLTVSIDNGGDVFEVEMSASEFLGRVLFSEEKKATYNLSGKVDFQTINGRQICDMYRLELNTYWVGEYDVIYHYTTGGYVAELVDTSLFYDHVAPDKDGRTTGTLAYGDREVG